MKAPAKNVTLTPHLDAYLSDLVASGRYSSASEVVRESLRLHEERERERALKLEGLRALVAEGRASGPAVPWDAEAFLKRARRHESD